MTRLLAVLALAASLLLAACGGSGSSGLEESLAPIGSDSAPSVETSPEESMSPEASPS
jgi:ABC-type glycerol-3-phosphate transport system substrate-binding protein